MTEETLPEVQAALKKTISELYAAGTEQKGQLTELQEMDKRQKKPSRLSRKRIYTNGRKMLPNWSGAARNSQKPARRLLSHCAVRYKT